MELNQQKTQFYMYSYLHKKANKTASQLWFLSNKWLVSQYFSLYSGNSIFVVYHYKDNRDAFWHEPMS